MKKKKKKNTTPQPMGVSETTPIWPRGWLIRPHLTEIGVASQPYNPWEWSNQPQGAN